MFCVCLQNIKSVDNVCYVPFCLYVWNIQSSVVLYGCYVQAAGRLVTKTMCIHFEPDQPLMQWVLQPSTE